MRKSFSFSLSPRSVELLKRGFLRTIHGDEVKLNPNLGIRVEHVTVAQPQAAETVSEQRPGNAQTDVVNGAEANIAPRPAELSTAATDSAAGIAALPIDMFATDAEETAPTATDTPLADVARCQWCSEPIDADTVVCPSCGSRARGESGLSIPGLTDLRPSDAAALERPIRKPGRQYGEAQAGEIVVTVIKHVIDDI
jgi:ribosomal protein L34E